MTVVVDILIAVYAGLGAYSGVVRFSHYGVLKQRLAVQQSVGDQLTVRGRAEIAGRAGRLRSTLLALADAVICVVTWPAFVAMGHRVRRGTVRPLQWTYWSMLHPADALSAMVMSLAAVSLLLIRHSAGLSWAVAGFGCVLVGALLVKFATLAANPGGLAGAVRHGDRSPIVSAAVIALFDYISVIACLTAVLHPPVRNTISATTLLAEVRYFGSMSHVSAVLRQGWPGSAGAVAVVLSVAFTGTVLNQLARYKQFRRTSEDHGRRACALVVLGNPDAARHELRKVLPTAEDGGYAVSEAEIMIALADRDLPAALALQRPALDTALRRARTRRKLPQPDLSLWALYSSSHRLAWTNADYCALVAFAQSVGVSDGCAAGLTDQVCSLWKPPGEQLRPLLAGTPAGYPVTARLIRLFIELGDDGAAATKAFLGEAPPAGPDTSIVVHIVRTGLALFNRDGLAHTDELDRITSEINALLDAAEGAGLETIDYAQALCLQSCLQTFERRSAALRRAGLVIPLPRIAAVRARLPVVSWSGIDP